MDDVVRGKIMSRVLSISFYRLDFVTKSGLNSEIRENYWHTHTHTHTDEQEDEDGDGHHERRVSIESDGLDDPRLEDLIPPGS